MFKPDVNLRRTNNTAFVVFIWLTAQHIICPGDFHSLQGEGNEQTAHQTVQSRLE